ncbi:MAG: protein phosphatase 2C domain-containing protein [Gemmataceae bacterium]
MTNFDLIDYASLSDVGVRRSHNQDAQAVLLATDEAHWREHGHIFLVADGMGAHAVGELASAMAVGLIPHTYQKHAPQGVAAALHRAFVEANTTIHERGMQNKEFKGMGTTTSALVLRPEGAWIGHVGDSRIYRIRNGRIEQLSYDHSLRWEMARRQHVSPEEMQGVRSNVILRSLGPEPHMEPDVEGPHPVRGGDTFLLCSDGLSGPIPDVELGAVISVLPPAEACQFLIQLANLRGGPDNITAIIVNVKANAHFEETTASPTPKKRTSRWLWPILTLLVGVLLAAGAVGLTLMEMGGGPILFLAAVVALLAGSIGLALIYLRGDDEAEGTEVAHHGKVYRHQSCRIDRAILDKFSRLETELRAKVRSKNWNLDWAQHQRHGAKAEKFLAEDNLSAAFRETCRALYLLMATFHEQRHKEEVFQPHWEKEEK